MMPSRRAATKRRKQAAFVAMVCLIGASIGTVAAYSVRWSENAASPTGERRSPIGRLSGPTADPIAVDSDPEDISMDIAEDLIGSDDTLPE